MASRIKKGDTVQVLSGKYKGQSGAVLEVLVSKERVKVEGLATVKRHLRRGVNPAYPDGGIVDLPGSIHISNVAVLDPKDGKPTRVAFKTAKDGSKVRVSRRSGEEIASAS